MSNMVTKEVKFTYYQLVIELDVVAAKNWIKLNPGSDANKSINVLIASHNSGTIPACFDTILDHVKTQRINAVQTNREKMAEIDLKTIKETNDTIFFQITNFRDVNIPSKKKLGQDREDIKLDSDEYIGEFLSIIYQRQTDIIMVQSNRYALTTLQLQEYFTSLLFEGYGLEQSSFSFLSVNLRPIINIDALKKINKKSIINKLTIKGSDNSLRALIPNEKNSLYLIRKLLEDFEGVEFEITIKANYGRKHSEPLKIEPILETLKEYQDKSDKPLPAIETCIKHPDYRKSEAINWLIPTVQSIIPFKLERRATLPYEYVYSEMHPVFLQKNNELLQILFSKKLKGDEQDS